MASRKNIGYGNYCNRMYTELVDMKKKLLDFVSEIEHMKGPDRESLEYQIPHFQDMARTIEWKLEILTRVCPFEWAGYPDVEKTASIRVDEEFVQKEVIGAGNIGG